MAEKLGGFKGEVINWLNDHESLIIAISVAFAAFGVILAATSSYLTYKQLQLINNERATPYKAIFYNAKVSALSDFSASSKLYTSTVAWSNDVVQADIRGLGFKIPGLKEELLAAVEKEREARFSLERALAGRGAVWTSALLVKMMSDLEATVTQIDFCFNSVSVPDPKLS